MDEHTLDYVKEGQRMTRSLVIPYICVILAVSYVGGTFLYRFIDDGAIENILLLFDARIVQADVNIVFPLLSLIMSFVLVVLFARFRHTKRFVYCWAAFRAVLFGMGASYLLANCLSMIYYAIWWFPFQLVITFCYFLFTVLLAPPFFMRTIGNRTVNYEGLLTIFGLTMFLFWVEYTIFHFIVK